MQGVRARSLSVNNPGIFMFKWLLLCVLALSTAACGSSSTNCATLLQQYATELASALRCDPNITTSQCSAHRPVTVGLDGGALEGIAPNCTHAVNANRTEKLDLILSEYTSAGCNTLPVPFCQPLRDSCGFSQSAGATICLP